MSVDAGLARLVPAVGWLPRYRRDWFGRDLMGGLAAGSVVIPQAMAYASIADLPPEVGLYTCIVPMLVYAFVGGSRALSVSTTSTVAVLTGSTLLSASVAATGDDPARDLATLTVLVGLILLAARVLRLGTIIDNISDATLTGIKIGVGLTVAAGQLPKLLGVDGDPTADGFFAEIRAVLDDLDAVSWTTIALSAGTLASLVALARFAPRLPAPLFAVALGIVLVAIGSLDDHGVALIDPVPSGLPLPVLPSLDHAAGMAGGALAIAAMCFLETASVATAVRRRDEPPIDNDQELAATGACCVLGGLFRAMPSAGGFSQTAINQRAGSRTQVSEMVTVGLAIACALFLGGVLSDLPEATLGCLVIVAVSGLVDIEPLVRYWRIDRLSFWVATVTAAVGLTMGLLAAVLVGVVFTLLLVLHELNVLDVSELEPTADDADLEPAGPSTRPVPGLIVLRPTGPLYAANVRRVTRAVSDAVATASARTAVVDLAASPRITVSVAAALDELGRQLAADGAALWLASAPPGAGAVLDGAAAGATEDVHHSFPTALAALREYRVTAP